MAWQRVGTREDDTVKGFYLKEEQRERLILNNFKKPILME